MIAEAFNKLYSSIGPILAGRIPGSGISPTSCIANSNPEIICLIQVTQEEVTLGWRHNGLDSVSNHQPHDCLLNHSFGRRSKKTSKLRITGLCVRNSPVTGEFPAQMARNAENVSIWWRHHGVRLYLGWRIPGLAWITFTVKEWNRPINIYCPFWLTSSTYI